MGVARNTFYLEIRGMGNVVPVVPAWDGALTHSLVSMLSVEKKRDRLSSQISNLAARSCGCVCRLAHGCSCLGRHRLVSAAPFSTWEAGFLLSTVTLRRAQEGKKRSYFVLFAFMFGRIFQRDEVTNTGGFNILQHLQSKMRTGYDFLSLKPNIQNLAKLEFKAKIVWLEPIPKHHFKNSTRV